jgi:hypothetical protein
MSGHDAYAVAARFDLRMKVVERENSKKRRAISPIG